MLFVNVLTLTLLSLVGVLANEEISSETTTTTESILTSTGSASEKIARRIIDERLTPPRATDFAPWNNNKRQLPVGEVHRGSGQPARVTEDLDDNVTEKAVPRRNAGSAQEPGCCGGKSLDDKEKKTSSAQQNQEVLDLERGNVGNSNAGPAPRFHGNRPSDDRYNNHGWKSSSYLGYGYGKDKGYYDQRNHYAYDRYGSAPRPTSQGYDGDRYGSPQRPSSVYGADGDRYGPGSTTRPGGGINNNNNNNNNYQSANYGFGGGSYLDRPRPGGNGNYGGVSGNIAGEGEDGDYPFSEGGPPTGIPPSHLQTQKAVALKALAGVALIGAAAALASNPVLLPISVLSGRRKRSTIVESDNYALTALLQGYIQPKPNEVAEKRNSGSKSNNNNSTEIMTSQEELVISPQCVARLACHVHRDYLDELERSKTELLSAANNDTDEAALKDLQHWFNSLVHSNILVADYLSQELKSLIQSAVAVGSNKNASCDEFSCLNVQDQPKKKTP